MFGDQAMIYTTPRSATIIAKNTTSAITLYRLHYDIFKEILNSYKFTKEDEEFYHELDQVINQVKGSTSTTMYGGDVSILHCT